MIGEDDQTPERSANSGRKPNRTIAVPPDFSRGYHYSDLKKIAEAWKLDFYCEVVPHSQHGKIIRFDLFGTGPKLDTAVRAVNKWIETANMRSPASSTWAKMPAFEYNKWYETQLREVEKERKQKFKGTKPEDTEAVLYRVSLSSYRRYSPHENGAWY